MRIKPTKSGGRVIDGDTPYGRFRFEVDRQGQLLDYECVVTEPIPTDFNPETERRAAKQGGCCGTPAE